MFMVHLCLYGCEGGEGISLARNEMSYRPSFGGGLQETHQSVSAPGLGLVNCGGRQPQ